MSLTYRQNTLLISTNSSPEWAASYTVTVYPVGGVAASASSGSTITLDKGHGFVAGDHALISPGVKGGLLAGIFTAAISSVTATTIVFSSETYSVSAGDLLVNLGPDTGSSSPNYDGSPMAIYSDADAGTTISNARVTASTSGEYSYYYHGDGRCWELIRNSAGTVTDVIAGYAAVPGRYHVNDFGAVGDDFTDDTTRIQRAMDVTASLGGGVHLGPLTYKTTTSLTLNWTATPSNGLPASPLITFFEGEGASSVIKNYTCSANRGALEFMGESNSNAVSSLAVRDFVIRQVGTLAGGSADSSSYGLRVGDAKEAVTFDRVIVRGANALSMLIASSSSYALIDVAFRNCTFRSNYNNEWFASDSGTTQRAVEQSQSGGAFWDNVVFDNCNFFGQVYTRATACAFTGCLFSNNPNRHSSYYNAVVVGLGSASFVECYWEDFVVGLQVAGFLAAVRSVSLYRCHFSSATNFGTNPSYGIQISDSTYGCGSVAIHNCTFGASGGTWGIGEIYITGSMGTGGPKFVSIISPVDITDLTVEPTISLSGAFTGRYWIQYTTGRLDTNCLHVSDTAFGSDAITAQPATFRRSVNTSSADPGAGGAGVELWNPNTVISGTGCESALTFRGRSAGGQSTETFAAIYGRVDTHSTGVGLAGYIGIGTKATAATTFLTERVKIAKDGTVTATNDVTVNGKLTSADRLLLDSPTTFSDGATTPSINTGTVYKTANTGATTITDFNNGVTGQLIVVLFGDALTTINFAGASINGNGGSDWTPANGDSMVAYYDGSVWWAVISA